MFENLVIAQQSIKKEKIRKKKKLLFCKCGSTDKITAAGSLLLQTTLYRAKMDLPTES